MHLNESWFKKAAYSCQNFSLTFTTAKESMLHLWDDTNGQKNSDITGFSCYL